MNKNNLIDKKRIQTIVSLFIETEIEKYRHQKQQYGLVSKYFRFVHLGNRLVHKISSAKNTTFILKSKEGDVEIKIIKGSGDTTAVVTIENNELCWQKD